MTDADKLRVIRALYILAYTSEKSLVPIAVELFHLLGDILEGTPIGELELHSIDRKELLLTLEELSPQEKAGNDGYDCEAESDTCDSRLEPGGCGRHQQSGNVHKGKRSAATTVGVAGFVEEA